MPIKHKKISNIASTGDPSLVQPGDWNDDHIVNGDVDLSNASNVTAPQITLVERPSDPAPPPPSKVILYAKTDDQVYYESNSGTVVGPLGNPQRANLPNTVLAFSATPSFDATTNHAYSMVLTGNVTSSTVTGTPVNGNILGFHICQDGVGGRTFNWPANFLTPPTIQAGAGLCNDETFRFDGTNWIPFKQPGGGTGGTPAGPNNSIQKNNSGAFGASSITDDGTTVTVGNAASLSSTLAVTGISDFNADTIFRGPNPYVDVRQFNARAVSSIPSTTGSINSGSATLTVASATGFQINDGIVVRGAGTSLSISTPAAPTVVASNAQGATGTGITQPNSTGATTYQYQIVARTTGGSYTPASAVTSIANGPATLGSNTVNISSWTASNQSITVNTSSNHNLVPGSLVLIQGAGNANGWWQVATTPTTSSFTFGTADDTRLGADVSGGAFGSVTWWNCNHISWTPVTGAYQYLIYGRTAGSMNLIGVSYPQTSTFGTSIVGDALDNTFDDFGSTMTANLSGSNVPDYYPLTPPGAGKNNDLVTTISNIVSTTFTLAATAGNTVAAATTKFDNAPNLRTAATTLGPLGNIMYFPAGTGTFVTNSFLNLGVFPNTLQIVQAGNITLGDTVQLGITQWSGQPINPASQSQFQLWKFPQINSAVASPMVYAVNSINKLDHLSFTSTNPQVHIYVNDQGGGIPMMEIDHLNFSTASLSDYMATHFTFRADVNGGGNITAKNVGLSAGLSNTLGLTATPLWLMESAGILTMENFSMNRRGVFITHPASGLLVVARHFYIQGGITPLFTLWNTGASQISISFEVGHVILDTTSAPVFTMMGNWNGAVKLPTATSASGQPIFSVTGLIPVSIRVDTSAGTATPAAQAANAVSIPIVGSAQDGLLSTSRGTYSNSVFNSGISLGNYYQITAQSAVQAAPTCAVSAGGSVAINSYTFRIAPVFPGLGLGSLSQASSTCTTTGGNQTITVNWATVPGAIGYSLYANNQAFATAGAWQTPGTVTQYIWSSGTTGASGAPTVIGSGPVGLNVNGLWSPRLQMVSTDLGGTSTITAPVLSAARSHNLPDLAGTFTVMPTIANNTVGNFLPAHSVVGDAHTAGTIVDSGVQLMSVFDDMHHPNGTIQTANPNWSASVSTINITGNAANGTSSAQTFANYTGVSWPSADQWAVISVSGPGGAGQATRVTVRAAQGAQTAYLCSLAGGTTTLNLSKAVAGTFTTLNAITLPATLQNGDTIGISAVGTTITCYVNGKNVGSATDASITTGVPGISFFGNGGASITSFAASYGSVSLGFAQSWSAIQSASSTGGFDANASTSTSAGLRVPNIAGGTTTTAGAFVFDPTNKGLHTGANGVDNLVGLIPSSITPANNDCVKWTVSGGVVTLNTNGSACGTTSLPLSSLTAAAGANSINNGDNAQTWNWALTTAAKAAFKLTENTAAINGAGNQFLHQISTIAGSTAVPLNITSSLTGTQVLPTLSITPTWNTSGVVDAALFINPTNTTSGTGSLLIDAQLGNTSQWKVDKAGNTTQLGVISAGSSAPACTAGTAGGSCLNEGTAPSSGANFDTLYAASADHMLHQNLNNGGDLPVPNRQMLTSTYTNATTTASNITGLSFAVAASANYTWTCHLYWQGSASTAGLDITITGPASPTSVFYSYDEFPTATTSQDAVANAFSTKLVGNATVTATTNFHATITMGLRNGANAGTIQLQGSATGAGTVTVQAGSYCMVA